MNVTPHTVYNRSSSDENNTHWYQFLVDCKRGCITNCSQCREEETFAYLADTTVYLERKRIHAEDGSDYEALLASAARSLKGSKESMHAALVNLTNTYVEEIHTHFQIEPTIWHPSICQVHSRDFSASHPFQLLSNDFDPASRMIVQGPIADLKRLATQHIGVHTNPRIQS